jgi:hypothetical protein
VISASKLTFKGRQPNASPEILRCLWNWENRVHKWKIPNIAKKAWEKMQWARLRPRAAAGLSAAAK